MKTAGDLNPILLYSSVLLFFGGVGAFAYWWSRRERQEREAFCAEHGLEFEEDGAPVDIPESFEIFKRSPRGASPRLMEAMHRSSGKGALGLATIGYYESASSGRRARAYRSLFGFLYRPGLRLPHVSVAPRRWIDRMWRPLEIATGDAVFEQRFSITGQNPGEVLVLLTDRVRMELFQQQRLRLECKGAKVVVYAPTRMGELQRFRPGRAKRILAVLEALEQALDASDGGL